MMEGLVRNGTPVLCNSSGGDIRLPCPAVFLLAVVTFPDHLKPRVAIAFLDDPELLASKQPPEADSERNVSVTSLCNSNVSATGGWLPTASRSASDRCAVSSVTRL